MIIKIVKYLTLILSIIIISAYNVDMPDPIKENTSTNLEMLNGSPTTPKSMIMYEMIEKYSDIYNVPKYIAYNVAYRETRYKGPFDWDYDPEQGSYAGALGPMQIMPSTGRSIYNKIMGFEDEITNHDLRTNIELNVMLSMKILSRSYKKYGNWSIVCGRYNTGQSIVNEYAVYCSSNKDYRSKWVRYD